MIFYGWNRVVEKCLGEFQGSSCGLCNETINYKLMVRRTFITLFFIPLICYRTEYYCKCTKCMATKQLSKHEAKDIFEMYLPRSRSKLMMGNLLRYLVMAVVVALFVFIVISPSDDVTTGGQENGALSISEIKKMVEDDGEYAIYNPEGKIVADVTAKDDVKRLNYLYEYYQVTEDVPEGHEFTEMHYYYERNKDEMAYLEDTSVVTCDENFVGIRYYEFEEYDETHYWYFGMNDFNNIAYYEDRTVYPMQQVISETDTEYYSKVRVQEGEYEAIMTFYHGTNQRGQNVLTSLDFIKKDPVTQNEEYFEYYQELDLAIDSTIEEILSCINRDDIKYDVRDYKEYYDGVDGVVLYREYDYVQNGQWRQAKLNYEVTQQDNGYYVAKLIE